jgi:hypothetical protein
MSLITFPKTLVLSCCLLLSGALYGASNKVVLESQRSEPTQQVFTAGLSIASVWAGPAKHEDDIKDDSKEDTSAPNGKSASLPDSYVATAAGSMFLAGILLLMSRLQRRKPRRNIYRYGRYGRSSLRSRPSRRAA